MTLSVLSLLMMKRKLIVMGSAPCLENDLVSLQLIIGNEGDLALRCDFLAVGLNCADRYLGRIEHAVSYHPKEFGEFRERREKAGGNLDYATHTHCRPELGHRVWPYFTPSGSSAMLGIEVGIGLGYEKIIVAGVMLTDGEYKRFQDGWKVRLDAIKNQVRAMNGFPRELLGAPTEEWLEN